MKLSGGGGDHSGLNPDTDTMCLDVGGAGALANSVTSFTSTNRTNALRVNQRFLTTMRLRGYTGANNDNTAVQNYLDGRNANVNPIGTLAQNNVAGGAPGFLNTSPAGSACPQP